MKLNGDYFSLGQIIARLASSMNHAERSNSGCWPSFILPLKKQTVKTVTCFKKMKIVISNWSFCLLSYITLTHQPDIWACAFLHAYNVVAMCHWLLSAMKNNTIKNKLAVYVALASSDAPCFSKYHLWPLDNMLPETRHSTMAWKGGMILSYHGDHRNAQDEASWF